MTSPGDRRARDDRRKLRRGVWKAATNGVEPVGGRARRAPGRRRWGPGRSWPWAARPTRRWWPGICRARSSGREVLGNAPAAEPVQLPAPRDVATALREPLGEILPRAAGAEAGGGRDAGRGAGAPERRRWRRSGELERRAAALLARGDALARYLVGAGVPAVREAVAELRAAGARAPATRRRARSTRARWRAKREHLRDAGGDHRRPGSHRRPPDPGGGAAVVAAAQDRAPAQRWTPRRWKGCRAT